MKPLDAVHEDGSGLGIVDMCTVFVAESITTNLFSIEVLLNGFWCRLQALGEGDNGGDEDDGQAHEDDSSGDRTRLPEGSDGCTKAGEERRKTIHDV